MKKWTLLATLALACGTTSGKSSNPDGDELSTYESFSLWGKGMAGFTAPPSNQVAGADGGSGWDDTGGWGDDGGWDDTGGWADGGWDDGDDDGGDDDGGDSEGACINESEGYCFDSASYEDCEEDGGIWAGAGTTCDMFGMSRMDCTIDLEHTTSSSIRTVGGVK